MKKFALIGDGRIAQYHRKAIGHVGGEIVCVIDPKYKYREQKYPHHVSKLSDFVLMNSIGLWNQIDYFVIASPSNFHRPQIQYLLNCKYSIGKEFQIICEKPAFLPWEPVICDDRINIVLQLRYLPNLLGSAERISVRYVRDDAYFDLWQGDHRRSGGLFFHLFIHAIDLAILLDASFEGSVVRSGKPEMWIESEYECDEDVDILSADIQGCYNRLYEAILAGKGIKPSDLFYLNWILQRNSEIYGYGRNAIGKTIKIGRELL